MEIIKAIEFTSEKVLVDAVTVEILKLGSNQDFAQNIQVKQRMFLLNHKKLILVTTILVGGPSLQALSFGDVKVPAGTYTLWTIPGKADWTIILNSKKYGWGVDFN